MPILQTHRQAITLLERSRVFVEDGRLLYDQALGGQQLVWNLPSATLSCLALGQGSSITSNAARILAQDHVGLLMTGSDGTPVFMASLSEYRPTNRFQQWITQWQDPNWRKAASVVFQEHRTRYIRAQWTAVQQRPDPSHALDAFLASLSIANTIEHILSAEAVLTKRLYKIMSEHTHTAWTGRRNATPSLLEKRLDQGNYLAYGLASMTLWTLGLVPSLPVTHGQTRAGGLVFDVADIFKDAFVLPFAFEKGYLKSSEYRHELCLSLNRGNVISSCIDCIDAVLAL